MRILLLGNSRAPYLESLRSAVSDSTWIVEIFDPYQGRFFDASGREAAWNDAGAGFWKGLGLLGRVGCLRRFLSQRRGRYDIINIHYHSGLYGLVAGELSRAGKKLIVSVWGDDLMAVHGPLKWLQSGVYRRTHAVTINNPERVRDFESRFPEVVTKVGSPAVCFLPMGILDQIDAVTERMPRDEIRRSLNLQTGDVVIACGTEGSSTQRHVEILRSLESVAVKLPPQAVLVFSISYGGSSRYLKKLRQALSHSTDLSIRILDQFLSVEELARWRCATDVLVLVQTQDQFKAAVQELLYTGCRIVVGRWLPYGFLEARGFDLHRIDSVCEVGPAVVEVIPSQVDLDRRRRMVREIASEESAGKAWRELYLRVLGSGVERS